MRRALCTNRRAPQLSCEATILPEEAGNPMREDDMVTAAELYYFEGQTQSAIGKKLGCTRWTVGRLLEQARASGLVTITINHPRARNRELEQGLEQCFHLERAIVVASPEAGNVAQVAARYLADLEPTPKRVAVSWGRTVGRVAEELPQSWAPNAKIYQTNGGPVQTGDEAVSRSIGVMARRAPGVGYSLPAPAITANKTLGDALRGEPSIARTLVNAAKAEHIIYSPGAVSVDSVLVESGYLDASAIEAIQNRQGVADVLSHYVDANGVPLSQSLESRTISISLQELRQAHAIAIVDEVEKVPALSAVLAGGYARVVITDATVARRVLDGCANTPQGARDLDVATPSSKNRFQKQFQKQ
ncbi:sugar-binding domain-containing protein [Gleimia hominis]|uniref:Sugar-binding domain-containing protein n=1 Tax=Gleimia hominis TaxID=595468 RepID=A0ABU3IBV7_9ACTO|nr:sugar-binding domain-containing protein [Gleimia hominis]MDT3767863.1 sugar-binding domain-containing protein [Gleimia hominis]